MPKLSLTDQCRAALTKRLKRPPTKAELAEALPHFRRGLTTAKAVTAGVFTRSPSEAKRGKK